MDRRYTVYLIYALPDPGHEIIHSAASNGNRLTPAPGGALE